MGRGRQDDPDKFTRHHILPSSRWNGSSEQKKGLKKDDNWNIMIIRRKYHDAWHLLFSNMTIPEVIEHINNHWGQSNIE